MLPNPLRKAEGPYSALHQSGLHPLFPFPLVSSLPCVFSGQCEFWQQSSQCANGISWSHLNWDLQYCWPSRQTHPHLLAHSPLFPRFLVYSILLSVPWQHLPTAPDQHVQAVQAELLAMSEGKSVFPTRPDHQRCDHIDFVNTLSCERKCHFGRLSC